MTETIVGIQTFVDPAIPGFSAIIKQRYSDFIVNEVDQENQTVRLTSYDLPVPDPEGIRLREEQLQAKEDAEQANREMGDEAKLAELAAVLDNDEETMTQIRKMLDSYGNDVEFVNLKPQDDKAKRTMIHKVIKERFSGRMISETVEGTMRLRMHKKKDDFDRRGKVKYDIWKDLGGEFCRFCLFKENRETMEAINHLTTTLRVPGKVFTFAGTKDRRGITSQWVTAHKVKAERLLALNKGLRNMNLGNFSYVPKSLKLGDLNGNRFMITLRNVQVDSEDTLNKSMTSLRDKGFINYFGMQRFGTGSVGTHEVGGAILRGEWEAAVDLIMKPRLGEGPDLEKARKHWAEHKDAKEAIKLFPRRWVAEYQILWSFQKTGHQRQPFEALNNIPRNLRLMYVHAYQSYIWNHMVTERIALYGADKPVVGDLVAIDKNALEAGDENMDDNSNDNNRGASSKGDSHVRAKVLTEEDVDQYTIYDVILPLPGFDVIYPTHAIGAKYKELMAKDGLDPHSMKRGNKEYSLSGSYRSFLSKPENVEWEIVRYDQADIPLTLTDQERMEGKPQPLLVPDGKYLALILNLTLKSSQYATMAIREVCKQDTSAGFQATLNTVDSTANSTTASAAVTPAETTPVVTPAETPAETPSAMSADGKGEETTGASKRSIEEVEGATPGPEAKASKD
ncbi:multisubstrate pseudouridine synthase 7 [Linnemannia hyalina]|uniref:Multisubstrate pseudouridine synthase 7 n=1 Tax=Linnemannia hyalina TaxID=64524 RepID=A0A9P7XMZ4_9FUNG|nr:multisubstrate pseudouridine synthase 7 [Linnemannia hyalina]